VCPIDSWVVQILGQILRTVYFYLDHTNKNVANQARRIVRLIGVNGRCTGRFFDEYKRSDDLDVWIDRLTQRHWGCFRFNKILQILHDFDHCFSLGVGRRMVSLIYKNTLYGVPMTDREEDLDNEVAPMRVAPILLSDDGGTSVSAARTSDDFAPRQPLAQTRKRKSPQSLWF